MKIIEQVQLCIILSALFLSCKLLMLVSYILFSAVVILEFLISHLNYQINLFSVQMVLYHLLFMLVDISQWHMEVEEFYNSLWND